MKEGAASSAERSPALAIAPFSRALSASNDPGQGFEANRNRILITLLALNLMLMAFFVVLNSTATFDSKRGAVIASGMSTAAQKAAKSISANVAPAETATSPDTGGIGTSARVAAAEELRAAVADVFASVLPAGTEAVADAEDGRVDMEMPAESADTNELTTAMIAGLAHVMENSPPGYRTELVIQAPDQQTSNLARLAQNLVDRGVAAGALSVGTLTGHASPGLHFTFLLLEPGEQSRAVRSSGRGRS